MNPCLSSCTNKVHLNRVLLLKKGIYSQGEQFLFFKSRQLFMRDKTVLILSLRKVYAIRLIWTCLGNRYYQVYADSEDLDQLIYPGSLYIGLH